MRSRFVSVTVPRLQLLAACMVLVFIPLFPGCGGDSSPAPGEPTTSALPPESPAIPEKPIQSRPAVPATEVKISWIEAVDTLPLVVDDTAVVAAGKFEPEGAKFPEGIDVTWPLAKKQPSGTQLHIVQLVGRRWYDTGEKAFVSESGKTATGKLYHFSTQAVSSKPPILQAPSGKPVVVNPDGRFSTEPEDKQADRLVPRVRQPVVVNKDLRKAALDVYESMKDRKLTSDDFKKLLAASDYGTIKTLIEEGKISASHNHQLGDWRIYHLIDSLKDFCAKNPGVKLYRSDTGNQKNAFLSDVDQTLFAYRYNNETGQWERWPAGDTQVKQHSHDRLRQMGIGIDKMDVETMPGRDRFIDERLVSAEVDKLVQAELRGQSRAIIIQFANAALGFQPGAYFLAGTVKQQQQLRVADLASKHLQGTIHPDDRPIEVKATKDMIGRLNGQVCTEIGPPDDNPRGEIGVREGTFEDATRVLMDGLTPELQRGWSYDASVDNWFKYMEKVKYALDPTKTPPVKYLLRGVNNGPALIAHMNNKMAYLEYEKLKPSQRKQFMIHCFGQDLDAKRGSRWDARDGSSFLDRWQLAMDISAEIRNISAVDQRPVTQVDLENAFRPLAEKMAGTGNEGRWKEFLPQARAEYNARCQEILSHSMVTTAKERILGWLVVDADNPNNREEIRKHVDEMEIRRAYRMEDPKFDAEWNKMRGEIYGHFADTAHASLMYSFRMMNQETIKTIIEMAERNPTLSPDDVKQLRDLAAKATHWTFHIHRYRDFPQLYHHMIVEFSKYKFDVIKQRIKDWLLREIGYIDTSDGRRVPNPVFRAVGLDGADRFLFDSFKKYRAAGITARFVKNMTYDIGNVDGIVQVLRASSESNGDPEVIQEAMIRETLYAVPVLGQAMSFYRVRTPWDAVQTSVLLGCAMASPYGRAAMLIFSIGEAGVVIYNSDYRAPLANAVADAVYRGFTGPSLYGFAEAPKQWTAADEERLSQIQSDLRVMKIGLANAQEMAGLLAEEQRLEALKARWKGYVAEQARNEGGWFTGTAAQLKQKVIQFPSADPQFGPEHRMWLAGPILARVKPYILFTSSKLGPVQFYLPPLTPQENDRITELLKQQNKETDPIKQYEIAEELQKLTTHHEAWKRAQDYLKRAQQIPELMHQIRVDSLYPYMLEDKSHEMVSMTKFVDDWVAFRREMLTKTLTDAGLKVDAQALTDARQQLSQRLVEDMERSKQRWEQFSKFKQGREEKIKQWYEQAKIRVHVEALMMAVENKVNRLSAEVLAALQEAGVDISYAYANEYLGEAIKNRHRPITAPELKIGGRILQGDPEAKTEQDRQHKFLPDVRITADPTVYVQPYSYAVYQLNHKSARQALSGSYRGLLVDDAMKKGLQQYLENIEEPADDEVLRAPAFLVYAFCSDFKLPDRVVKKTSDKLPRLKKVTVPGDGRQAYLLGGASLWKDLDPVMPPGPLQIQTRRPKPNRDMTEIVVTSENLPKLDLAKKDTSLKYNIYIAQSNSGPWIKLGDTGFRAGTEIEEDSDQVRNAWDRIAVDKVVIGTEFLGLRMRENGWPHKPIYYRVGEQWQIGYSDEGLGKETYSNIVGPDEGFIDWTPVGEVPGKKKPAYDDNLVHRKHRNWEFGVHLGMGPKNQKFAFPGAHLIVEEAGRTRHYWTPRSEGETNFGGSPTVTHATTQTLVPVRGKETILNVSGEYPGFSAKRTFTIITEIPDKELAERREAVDRDTKATKEKIAKLKEKNQYDQRRVDDCGKRSAWFSNKIKEYEKKKPRPMRDINMHKKDLLLVQRDRIRLEADIKQRKECDIPYEQAALARRLARLKFELASANEHTTDMLEAEGKRGKILQERAEKLMAVNDKIYGYSDNADWTRKKREANKTQYTREIRRAKYHLQLWSAGMSGFTDIGEAICRDAHLAGDAEALKKRYQLRIDAYRIAQKWSAKERDKDSAKSSIGKLMQDYAKKYVELTGKRSEAATLFKRGWLMEQESRAGDRKKSWADLKYMPAWWPPAEANGRYDPPSSKNKSDDKPN